ncbi:MAG TPA: AAA family ATPase [Candidatus Acidoferrales bacterium]|nr:AAA family ATPase [Candidatus Acidoferrales bacterium]HEV3481342.1 AAA family ATPase [Candidatus Acidoferrales bacterium]
MRISEVTIENLRTFKKETIRFGNYVSLVGPNGAGKSTVLTALRIFFRDTADTVTDLQTLGKEDFHNKDTTREVVITITFEDLDEEAQRDLQHYYRHDKLVVSAVAHWNGERAEVVQYGERLGIKAFRAYFEAEKRRVNATELKEIYNGLCASRVGLPAPKSKAQMAEALVAYEGDHPDELELLRSEDRFYGFTGGSLLQKYIQWVFIPAVKDASTENAENKKNAFRLLLERTVRSKISFEDVLEQIRLETKEKYKNILEEGRDVLQALSVSLTDKLTKWAHPNASLRVQWEDDTSSHVKIDGPLACALGKEGTFEGDLSRFGHGFQRSYLLALLQELAGCPDTGNPRLILGCEEPELHQHPPQARHLADALHVLAGRNAQIVLSTHSPFFVRGLTFDDVRCVRYDHGRQESSVRGLNLTEVSQAIAAALGENPIPATGLELKVEEALQERVGEMFFAPALVFVEGIEDIGYLQTYITLLELRESLHGLGCHVIPTCGKNAMIRPIAIANQLGIPAFAVIDADSKKTRGRADERDNLAIMRLCGIADPEAFPENTLFSANLCVWPTEIGDVVQREIGADWEQFANAVTQKKGIHSNHGKNPIFIGLVLSAAWQAGKKSPSLENLCRQIMAFATRAAAAAMPKTE